MGTLSAILGFAGVILLLVGLLGGGFTFSGSVVPTVGKLVRLPCFVTGGLLVLLALGTAFTEAGFSEPAVASDVGAAQADPDPTEDSGDTRAPAGTADVSDTGIGIVMMEVEVREGPFADSPVVGTLVVDEQVDIYCTAYGDSVTRFDDGATSSLWNYIGWGFVPDAAIYTGTDLPTAVAC